MNTKDNLKVAIVCDWLTVVGGAELVILELHKMYPDAPIYTSQYDPKNIDWFKDADVRTTWLNKLPKSLKKFLPVLRALSFSRLDLSEYDLVISSSGAEAKAVKTGSNTTHICYCHSPTHYYWVRYDEYLENPGFGAFDWLARFGLKILIGPMKRWDFKAAQKPNYLIANSTYTKNNIKKYYGRDSKVIFPPVDVEKYHNQDNESRSGYIVIGRQTPYKMIGLAVSACTKLNIDLTVIGDGPEHEKLVKIAGPSIKFLGHVDNQTKIEHLKKAKCFIFTGVDDFGIAAIEALASGTPVIAYDDGGAIDYINKKNGILFSPQNIDGLIEAINNFSGEILSSEKIQKSSDLFSVNNFRNNLNNFIDSL